MSDKLEIPLKQSYILKDDFFEYISHYDSISTAGINKCSPMISKYQQPLQLYYFDQMGKLISFHNNCNTGGFPKLKWNNNHQFDKFVPLSTIPVTDSIISLARLIDFVKPLHADNSFYPRKYTVAVLWSGFMIKQSKELIKVVTDNLKLDTEKSAIVYFINVDNSFVEFNK